MPVIWRGTILWACATAHHAALLGGMENWRYIRWAVGIVLAIGLMSCGAEIYTRLRFPIYDQILLPAMFRADPRTIWRYRPGEEFSYTSPEFTMQIRTNDEGLRSASQGDSSDAPTILFIGDSFTFGWGVAQEQRFSEVIGRLLEQSTPGRRVRIVNAGHWLYALDQQLVLMKELIARYRPKVVVQNFYWMNIRSLHGHEYTRAPDGSLQSVRDANIAVDERGSLHLRSNKMELPPLHSEFLAAVAQTVLGRDLRDRVGDWMSYLHPGTQNDELWQRADDLVGESIRTARVPGIEYIPFLTPADIELPGGNWANAGWLGKEPPPDVDVDLPATRLANMFSRRSVHAIGLAGPMRAELAAGRARGHYYLQDGHWTAEAHALAGRLLMPYVAEALAQRP